MRELRDTYGVGTVADSYVAFGSTTHPPAAHYVGTVPTVRILFCARNQQTVVRHAPPYCIYY